MAFTQETLSKSSTGYAHIISGQEWIYASTTDTLAEIKADGYFDGAAPLFAVGETLNVGDLTFERDLLEIVEVNPTAPRIKTKEFVGAGSIPDGAITTDKLANLAVTTAKIDDAAVTTVKIDLNAVTTDKINAFAVTTAKIDSEAVTNVQLATNAVTTVKILDGNVTKDKIASTVLGAFRLISLFEIPTTNATTQNAVIPGAVAGDKATCVLSANGTAGLFILSTVFVNPDIINISYSVTPNSGTDKIQIFHYRLIT